MNTKKIIFAVLAGATLLVASCTPNSANNDDLYEQGVDKTKLPSTADKGK